VPDARGQSCGGSSMVSSSRRLSPQGSQDITAHNSVGRSDSTLKQAPTHLALALALRLPLLCE
jgi:hypothetical protein